MSEIELTQAQIDELRAQLIDLKTSLNRHLLQLDAAVKPVTLDQQSVGRVSRIDAIQQQQMALAGQQQSEIQLQQIEFSLQRIDQGEYGYCLECGELVQFARLQAQPTAQLCVKCQSARETG